MPFHVKIMLLVFLLCAIVLSISTSLKAEPYHMACGVTYKKYHDKNVDIRIPSTKIFCA